MQTNTYDPQRHGATPSLLSCRLNRAGLTKAIVQEIAFAAATMQQLVDPRHGAAKFGSLMRTFAVLLSIGVFGSTAALGENDCRCWTPSAQDIAALEARIKVQPTPLGGLDRYVRYYGGVIRSWDSRRGIQGKMVPPGANDIPGIQIVSGKMPPLQGEGCVSGSDTDGRWLYFRCARPGAWAPSDAQVAELEDALLRTGVLGIDRWTARSYSGWTSYARHYAGLTVRDQRVIEGILVANFDKDQKPGIYIESEAELPMIADGGCGVVGVTYYPSTKTIFAKCSGR